MLRYTSHHSFHNRANVALCLTILKQYGHLMRSSDTEHPCVKPHMKVSYHLDASDLFCPLPALKTQRQLNLMKTGEILLVSTTDPLAEIDISALCTRNGHKLLKQEGDQNAMRFYIECNALKKTDGT